jgi:tetratricopeptide (TPR) repeat protein
VLLAEVLRQSGELKLAAGVCEEAKLFGPNNQQAAMIHRTLGVIALSAGDFQRSLNCLRLALVDALRAGDREFLCQCYLDLSACLKRQGRPGDAILELKEGITVITHGEGLGVKQGPDRLWRLGLGLAELELDDDDLETALRTAQESLALCKRSKSQHAQGRMSALLARICEANGEGAAALQHRTDAIDALRTLGDRRSTAELLIETARSSTQPNTSEAPATDLDVTIQHAEELAREVAWNEGDRLASE